MFHTTNEIVLRLVHSVVPSTMGLMFNGNKGVMLPRREKMRNRDLRQRREGRVGCQQLKSPKL